MNIVINKLLPKEDLRDCFSIRRKVFIEGQNVPEADDFDGYDRESTHYLLLLDRIAIGTARVRYIENKAKIERVALLQEFHGQGYGKN
jgi:predicted GNAT family N-acyltransferase